jgi:hypothetical protein
MKAKSILDKVYDRFQTEYKQQFIDWSHYSPQPVQKTSDTAIQTQPHLKTHSTQCETEKNDIQPVQPLTSSLPHTQETQTLSKPAHTQETQTVSKPTQETRPLVSLPPRLASKLAAHYTRSKDQTIETEALATKNKATLTTPSHSTLRIVYEPSYDEPAGLPHSMMGLYHEKKHFPYQKDFLQIQLEEMEHILASRF